MGPRQHRLPAAFIGGFGEGCEGTSARYHKVNVKRRGKEVVEQSADSLNAERETYSLNSTEFARSAVDDLWSWYEPKLAHAAKNVLMRQQTISPDLILCGLVPHLAGVCVRGVVHDEAVAAATGHLSDLHVDNLNLSRVTNFQHLAGVLLRCCWRFMIAPEGSNFICNDLGYFVREAAPRVEVFFPLRPDLGVSVTGELGSSVPMWLGESRVAYYSAVVTEEIVRTANGSLAYAAKREIYGRRRSDVDIDFHERDEFPWIHPGAALSRYPAPQRWNDDMAWITALEENGLAQPPLPILTLPF